MKPNESKRDWFLFHMTPLGMNLAAERNRKDADARTKQIAIILGGTIAIGMIVAAYLTC